MKKIGKINIAAVLIIAFCMITIIKVKMPEEEIRSVTSNGVVATVEEVQSARNQAIVRVNLYKQDGSSFEKNTRVGNVKLSFKNGGGVSWHTSQELSEDQKVLSYIFKISKEEKTKFKDLNIELNELVIATEEQKILEESIYDLYAKYPLQYDYEQELPMISYEEDGEVQSDKKRELPKSMQGYEPIKEVSEFSILGVGFNKNSEAIDATPVFEKELLHIRTRFTGERQNVGNEARLDNLYDELTGEEINGFYAFSIYEGNASESNGEKDSNGEITEEYFELTNTEKLKHIKPIVSYIIREKIGTHEWNLSVSLKENVKSINRKVNLDIEVNHVPIQIEKVYISAIGAAIEGERAKEEEVSELLDVPVILYMKNGSICKLSQLSWAVEKEFAQQYSIDENNNGLINVEEVEAIEIAGKKVELLD